MNTLISDILRSVGNGLWNLNLSDEQLAQFSQYAELLVEWNATRMNLTRITEPHDIAVSHFLDSLAVFRVIEIPKNAHLIDVGTGAGMPGLALKIARPDIVLTLLDSTAKKLVFCRTVADELGLSHVQTLHTRAEEAGISREHAARYDVVTARAVAPMERLLPWCAPFLKPNGIFVALKGGGVIDELAAAKPVAKRLGLHLDKPIAVSLPEAKEPTVRQLIVGHRR